MKLTKWYPSEIKPVRIGVYQVMHNERLYASYWNGNNWGVCVGELSRHRVNQAVYDLAEVLQSIKAKEVLTWRGIKK